MITQIPLDQIVMGVGITLVSLWGILRAKWLLDNTKKGERLVNWLGEPKAIWVVRIFFGLFVLFGTLLATDIIRPIKW